MIAAASSLVLNRRHYADNLVEFLVSKRYQVCVINPFRLPAAEPYPYKYGADRVTCKDRQITDVESKMTEIMLGLDSVIMTIPGIGYINGGMILGEISDIHRFSTPCQLLAFAGLDPSVYQSRNFNASHTRKSKRGSRILRYALINAAHNVVKNNNTFKAYYDAKMAEGRNHYNALGHCAGKLVRILFKMLTDDVAFNP